jgi:hypothetical protein
MARRWRGSCSIVTTMELSRVVAIIVSLASVAAAEPIGIGRVGGAYVSDGASYFGNPQPAAAGAGMDLEAELGWRARWWLGVAGYAAYRRFTGDVIPDSPTGSLYRVVSQDVVVGARLHYAQIPQLRLELGLGLGLDYQHDRIRDADLGSMTGLAYDITAATPLVRVGPTTLEASASFGYTAYDDRHDAIFGSLAIGAALAPSVAHGDSSPSGGPPPIELAFRAGVHRTKMSEEDNMLESNGPRVELEASWYALDWLSIAAIGAWSHYSVDGIGGSIDGPIHSVHITDLWLGARVLVHPHPRAFLGVTLWNQWDSFNEWSHMWAPEIVVGFGAARLGDRWRLDVSAAFTREHTDFEWFDSLAVMIGARWCGDHCRW